MYSRPTRQLEATETKWFGQIDFSQQRRRAQRVTRRRTLMWDKRRERVRNNIMENQLTRAITKERNNDSTATTRLSFLFDLHILSTTATVPVKSNVRGDKRERNASCVQHRRLAPLRVTSARAN